MKNLILFSLLTILLISAGCRSSRMRSPRASRAEAAQKAPERNTSVRVKKQETVKKPIAKTKKRKSRRSSKKDGYESKRFNDTTVIDMSSGDESLSMDISDMFDDAVKEFDLGNYSVACRQMQQYAETFAIGDSLRFEAQFLWSECLMVDGHNQEAANLLGDMFGDKKLPESIFEKVVVRLGQVYCVLGKKELAQKLFDLLKKKYPNSIYIPLADCAAVR